MKLKDIAEKAQVSVTTVSLVLNNKEGVSEKKRNLIKLLLVNNGYTINYQKSNIDKRSIRFLKYSKQGFAVDGNPGFVNAIVDAVEKECRKQGYDLMMTTFSERSLNDIIKMISDDPPSGIILLGTEMLPSEFALFDRILSPIVVVDNLMENIECTAITMNNHDAIYMAVDYLYILGHREIGFLHNSMATNNCFARKAAFEAAVKDIGITFDPALVYSVYPTPDGAYESICSLLRNGIRFPSALVANNDSIALGALKAFKEHSIRVPEDVSIIGFDGIPFSAFSDPPLTTISVSCKDMGIWSVRLLCDHILYPESVDSKILISVKLVERESTAPFSLGRSSQ